MGNKPSRKPSYALSNWRETWRETAYLTAPSVRTSDTVLSPELKELLKQENLMGVADKLKLFAENYKGGLDVPDLAGFSINDLQGSGLTPLQRRRIIRAASEAAQSPTRTKRDDTGRGVGDVLDRAGEGRSKGTRGGELVSYHINGSSVTPVPARKRNGKPSSSKSSPRKLKEKGRQMSAPINPIHAPSNSTDIVRPDSIAVVADINHSLIDDKVNADHCQQHDELSPVPEQAMKRAASDSMLLDRSVREDSIERSSDTQLQQAEKVKRPLTPPPTSPTSSIGDHWSRHSPVHFILEAMRRDLSDSDTIFGACQSLTRLIRQKLENRKAAYIDGAISVITEVLQRHFDVDLVVEHGLRVLARLCPGVPECVVEIVGSGGVEGIVNLMSQHGTHGGVCRAACMLLYNIAYQDFDSREMMVRAGVVHSALKMLKNFSSYPLSLMMACGLLSCICAQTPRAKVVVSEEEGPLSIVHAMQLHEGHLKLQMYGCAAIANVTFGDTAIADKAYADGIVRSITTAMTNHVTDSGVLLYGVKALFNLVQADDAWRLILETAIMDTVMDACRVYSKNEALHLWTCCLLHQTTERGQGEAKKRLVEHYIVNWCIFIMSVHEEISETYWAAKCLLHWFPPYNQFSMKPVISPVIT